MAIDIHKETDPRLTRRTFLGKTVRGVGSLALASLLTPSIINAAPEVERWQGIVPTPHVPPKAKRIIHLCMAGGPSHLETLDYKPKLAELHGQPMPKSFTEGQPIAQLQGQADSLKCLGPTHEFKKYGQSGQEISTAFPHIGSLADDICIVRSLLTEQINHDPAHTFMNTGTAIAGRPSMGSWLLYGLGSENENLPGYVVLTSSGGGQDQPIATRQWHSGFLPGQFQGVQFHSTGDPVHYVTNPGGVNTEQQRDVVDAVQTLNGMLDETVDDPAISTRISQYEMAFRMQTSVPELTDISKERGVRFIQLYHRCWDHHGGIENAIKTTSGYVDQATAALVNDLKQRGMLDDTLVIWGGEFGRTPMAQGTGRDHHIKGFSMWMAGGGIKGGISYGNTDELGYNSVENIVHVHDFHATMLHLFGINHEKLVYRFQGRDFRLTDVHGHIVRDILV